MSWTNLNEQFHNAQYNTELINQFDDTTIENVERDKYTNNLPYVEHHPHNKPDELKKTLYHINSRLNDIEERINQYDFRKHLSDKYVTECELKKVLNNYYDICESNKTYLTYPISKEDILHVAAHILCNK